MFTMLLYTNIIKLTQKLVYLEYLFTSGNSFPFSKDDIYRTDFFFILSHLPHVPDEAHVAMRI